MILCLPKRLELSDIGQYVGRNYSGALRFPISAGNREQLPSGAIAFQALKTIARFSLKPITAVRVVVSTNGLTDVLDSSLRTEVMFTNALRNP